MGQAEMGLQADAGARQVPLAAEIALLLVNDLCDNNDHPEIWEAFPQFLAMVPDLPELIADRLEIAASMPRNIGHALEVLHAMCLAYGGDLAAAASSLGALSVRVSQSPLVQGALFHVLGRMDPDNPRYALKGKFCPDPFERLEVLESTSNLCCASYLPLSAGDLNRKTWREVWNSENAQRIRASMHDGSFRHCNKMDCPVIQRDLLQSKAEVAAKSPYWRALIDAGETELDHGPVTVNLAYDKTCNLSCPSCRTEKIAADSETRARYARLQENAILPLLANTQTVFITGSGDPFASKNFRQLLERLVPEDYPDLRFIVMTNGMLFTPREWARFPALHGRVKSLQISLDAATGPTHELLRRGARWETMERNLAFAAELRRQGLVDRLNLRFTVQRENYREMGDAVDLCERIGADSIDFSRVTNWGTFSVAEYADKAVFVESHPEYHQFCEAIRDQRLRRPCAIMGNLTGFLTAA